MVINNSLVTVPAFSSMVEWLYTAQVKVEIRDMTDFTRLAKYCKLDDLEEEIDKAFQKANSWGDNPEFLIVIL